MAEVGKPFEMGQRVQVKLVWVTNSFCWKNRFWSMAAHTDVGLCMHLPQAPHFGQPWFAVLAQMSVVEQMLSCKLP